MFWRTRQLWRKGFSYVLLHQLYCIVLCIVLEHECSVNDLLLLLYSVQCQRIESPKPETLSTNCDFSPNFCVIRSNWCTRHEEKNYTPDCTLFNPHLFIPQRHSINSEGLLCLNWSAAIRRSSQTITRGHVSKGRDRVFINQAHPQTRNVSHFSFLILEIINCITFVITKAIKKSGITHQRTRLVTRADNHGQWEERAPAAS